MAAKTLKKKPMAEQEIEQVVIIETKAVPLKSLNMLLKNPNQGDVARIEKSLKGGQFRPIVVNVGSKTGRKNEILGGNHTYLAARRLGWKDIVVSFVDVNERTATVIVINDNDTSRAGTYDNDIYADLLASLPTLDGLSLDDDEADEIMARAVEQAEAAAKRVAPDDEEDEPERKKDPREKKTNDDSEDDDDGEASRPESVVSQQLALQGTLEAKQDMLFMGSNQWGIPDLREDMLMSLDDWPADVQTWAGYESLQHLPDDGKRWYFYNFGIIGRKGMPVDRSILAFNAHDHKFDQWWDHPAYHASKLIAEGLRYAVVPDFSFYDDTPTFSHLYGVYKGQWLGRFLQESGVRVIPRVQFKDESSLDFCMTGIPKNPPLLHCSVQNIARDKDRRADDLKTIRKCLQACIDEIDPTQGVIVYGGQPAKALLGRLRLPSGVKPIWVENYAAVRRGTVYDKPGGLGALSAKERKKIREQARDEESARLGTNTEPDVVDADEDE